VLLLIKLSVTGIKYRDQETKKVAKKINKITHIQGSGGVKPPMFYYVLLSWKNMHCSAQILD
jgi:hypothetical protein